MTDARLDLRPTIPTTAATKPAEQFQNTTLRPVLKLQNDLLLLTFRHYLQKRKVRFAEMSKDKRSAHIRNSVSKDNRLRGLLFGLILGQFTSSELEHYFSNESELNRRLTSMLMQRLESQL